MSDTQPSVKEARDRQDQRHQEQVRREAQKAMDHAMSPLLVMEAALALQALAKGHWDREADRDREDQITAAGELDQEAGA